jgi:plasmid stability protein
LDKQQDEEAHMTVDITLPQDLATLLQERAEAENRTLEEEALYLLRTALANGEAEPTPEQVVARIQATPAKPANMRPAQGSLAEALRSGMEDQAFDLAEWNQAWQSVENEMRAITRADDAAEGRADSLS